MIMGAYGERVLREFFLGSVSRTILEESAVPVFLAH
jgi:nucleotide-binding universal stress UspA family protein